MTEEKYLAFARPASTSFRSAWISPTNGTTISAPIRASTGISKDLIPRLAKLGHDDHRAQQLHPSENVGEIGAIADKARGVGRQSVLQRYSARRTGCRDYFLNTPEQLCN